MCNPPLSDGIHHGVSRVYSVLPDGFHDGIARGSPQPVASRHTVLEVSPFG